MITRAAINSCVSLILTLQPDARILRYVVLLPVRIYTEAALDIGQEVWTWIADARPDLEPRVVSLVLEAWSEALNRRHGLSNQTLRLVITTLPVPDEHQSYRYRHPPQLRKPPRPRDEVHPDRQRGPHARLPLSEPGLWTHALDAQLYAEPIPGLPVPQQSTRPPQHPIHAQKSQTPSPLEVRLQNTRCTRPKLDYG